MSLKNYVPKKIFTGEDWLEDHFVTVEDGVIKCIDPLSKISNDVERIDLPEQYLLPAFIDVQIYGAGGKLFAAYPTIESLEILNEYCKEGGATLFLPTVATNSLEVFHACINVIRQYWKVGGKGVYGLHLEGPWINEKKRGAHIKEFIHSPSVEEVKQLLEYGKDVIKMITLAPEVCSSEVVELIQSHNIIISAGHSNATFTEASHSFEKGINAVTHLYNAMSPLQHREPGLVGAVFQNKNVKASIIPDGHHVDFATISIAKKIMGERLFVITDAVTNTEIGGYKHQLVGDKYESDNILSGSALTMHKAFLNLVHKTEINAEEAIRMCSLYPAQVLGCDDKRGKIAPGYVAQFVVTNDQYKLVDVIT